MGDTPPEPRAISSTHACTHVHIANEFKYWSCFPGNTSSSPELTAEIGQDHLAHLCPRGLQSSDSGYMSMVFDLSADYMVPQQSGVKI